MTTSETAIFTSHEQPIELRNLPIPELKPGEILVRNEYTALCRSDLNTYCGKRFEPTPTILGHEIVGRIAAFGEGKAPLDLRDNQLAVGDRVSWAIFSSDPNSELSKQGIPQKGKDLFKYGHERLTDESTLHGGLGQFTLLKPNTPIVKVSENVPLKVVSIINCSVATIAGAIRQAGDIKGKNVLVYGAGMLGMIACAMSKTLGASSVAAIDLNKARLETAKHFGADVALVADEDISNNIVAAYGTSKPFNTVIELSGVAAAMEQTLDFLSIGSTAVWVGATYPERDVHFSAEKIIRNLITIKGLHNYNREDFLFAVNFIEQHHLNFPFAEMIYDHFSLKEVNEAFEYGLKVNPFRVGVRID